MVVPLPMLLLLLRAAPATPSFLDLQHSLQQRLCWSYNCKLLAVEEFFCLQLPSPGSLSWQQQGSIVLRCGSWLPLQEHLMLYAVIKGALWGEAAEVARQAAEEVRCACRLVALTGIAKSLHLPAYVNRCSCQ
jgi:hypothetical protein